MNGSDPFAHPGFAPYRRWLREDRVPDVATLNAWAHDADLALPDGRRLAFVEGVAAGAVAYEAAIFRDACIRLRRGSWHDAFNALTWLAFPRTKAALNARHVAEGSGASANARSRARDVTTLLDESGLVIACGDDSLRQLLRNHAWRALFESRREDVAARMHVSVLGHGLLEKLRAPYRALTAHALWLPLDVAAPTVQRAVDEAAAARLRAQAPAPGDLLPLPVAALPGWDTEGLGCVLFEDAAVFRPARARLVPS